MSKRLGLFATTEHPVLSLSVRAKLVATGRMQSQFEVLLRHLLYRFFHNEIFTSEDDETKRIILIGYAVALPALVVALFLFPAYHTFPPNPHPRPFWAQASDHYFYVMYSFVIMGSATIYEWDLLFPDLLDVHVLSILPIAARRLFFARVFALTIFFGLVLLGTGILGILFLPAIAELPNAARHLLAHAVAVLVSGTFAAATFLALQGTLICLLGERIFRRITPLLQGGSMMLLLIVLFLQPVLSRSITPILTSGDPRVLCFPPFWFLGIYESILGGRTTPAVFHLLAHIGCYALLTMLACALLTYPLAYRRKVRQLIEGGNATKSTSDATEPFQRVLHALILRSPAQRAIFHFIATTILRSQRQRVMLAMYAGLGIALTVAEVMGLRISGDRVHATLLAEKTPMAIPIMVFWTVAGLRSVLSSSIDRMGAWIFRVIIGCPRSDHLAGARIWVTLWATVLGTATGLFVHVLSSTNLRSTLLAGDQLLIAAGVSILLVDIFLFFMRAIPFTHFRKSSVTDVPLAVVRYFILFPIFVVATIHIQARIETSTLTLFKVSLIAFAAHLLIRKALERSIRQSTVDSLSDEADEFPQRLGLRSS
jgi:hypothetical protein